MKIQSIKSSTNDITDGYYLGTGYDKIDNPLQDSRGQIVFQEDLMKLFASVCGIEFGEADNVRKITAKKLSEEDPKHKILIDKTKAQWMQGCKDNQIPQDVADVWWNKIIANAEYSFNRSHAYAYSLLTVVTMQLRERYPLEYSAAYLSVYPNEKDSWISRLFSEGYEFIAPNVNTSGSDTYGTFNGKIALPLSIINGLGEKAASSIEENQPFASIQDFMNRVDLRLVNRTSRLRLWLIGAFEGIDGDFSELETSYLIDKNNSVIKVYDQKEKVSLRGQVKFLYKSIMNLQSSILSGTILFDSRAKQLLDKYVQRGYEFGCITKLANGVSKTGTPRIEIHFGKSLKPQLFVSQKMIKSLEYQLGGSLKEGMFFAYKRDRDNWGGKYLYSQRTGRNVSFAMYELTDSY